MLLASWRFFIKISPYSSSNLNAQILYTGYWILLLVSYWSWLCCGRHQVWKLGQIHQPFLWGEENDAFYMNNLNKLALFAAKLLCESHQDWRFQQNCYLLQTTDSNWGRNYLRLQIPYWGWKDQVRWILLHLLHLSTNFHCRCLCGSKSCRKYLN